MRMELGNPINRLSFIAENASEQEQLTALTQRLNTQYIRLNYQHNNKLHLILDTPIDSERRAVENLLEHHTFKNQ